MTCLQIYNHEREICAIELLANDFVSRWLQLLERSLAVDPKPVMGVASLVEPERRTSEDKTRITNRINAAIHGIETEYGVKFPYRAHPHMDRDLTNAIHRSFTTAYELLTMARDPHKRKFLHRFAAPEFWLMPRGQKYEHPKGDRESRLLFLLEEINFGIHEFEHALLPNERTAAMEEVAYRRHYRYHLLEFKNTDANNTIVEGLWQPFQEDDFQYFSNCHNVYLKRDILGKDHLQAFIDKDDPSEWDITPAMGFSAGLEIDPFNSRGRFKQSQAFHEWLRAYGLEPTPQICGQMPLGTIMRQDEYPSLKCQMQYFELRKSLDGPLIWAIGEPPPVKAADKDRQHPAKSAPHIVPPTSGQTDSHLQTETRA